MRRGALIALLLLFLSSSVAALTIEKPEDGAAFTEERVPGPGESVYVHVSTSAPYNDGLSYRIPGASRAHTLENEIIDGAVMVGEGTHTLTATAVDTGENTTQNQTKTVTFTVDSLPPTISTTTPHGAVTHTRNPTVSAHLDDTSTFTATLLVDGKDVATTRTNSLRHTPTGISEGQHTVTVRARDEYGHVQKKRWNFTLPRRPVISDVSPTGTVSGDVTVQVQAADPSGIAAEKTVITVFQEDTVVRRIGWDALRNGSERSGNQLRLMHTVSLPDGRYTMNVSITDNSSEGHTAHETWPVTVDTEAPTVTIQSHASGDIITETTQVGADVIDALSKVVSARFTLGDAEAVTATHLRHRYRTMLPLDDMQDGDHVLTAAGTDAAGNTGTDRVNVTVDTTAPTVSEVSVYPHTAADAVYVTGKAIDDATQIETMRYRVDGTDIRGTLSATDGTYDTTTEYSDSIIDVSDLAPGEYILYLTATDAASHRSNGVGERLSITNTTPSVDMTVEKGRSAAGSTTVLHGNLTNTGRVGERIRLSAESRLNVSLSTPVRHVGPGEKTRFSITATVPDNTDYGPAPIKVAGDGLATTTSDVTSVIVVPPAEEREDIETEFRQLKESFNSLEKGRSDRDVSDEQVAVAFTAAEAALQNASELMEEGRYDRAMAAIQQARQEVDTAENRFTGAVTQQRIRTAQDVIIKLVLGLLMLGAVYGGYRLIPPEAGFHPERGYVHRPDGKHPLRVKAEHWLEQRRRERTEEEPELVEAAEADDEPQHPVDEWTGFMT